MKRGRLTFRGVLIASSVVMIAIFAFSSLFARGGRTFFSPYTLETQSQIEFLLPFTEIPIFRSARHCYRYKLTDYLIAQGYWTPAAGNSEPLMTNHWNMQWRDGHSDIERQFEWKAMEWIDWTVRQPATAERLWPCVLNLLRSDSEDAGSITAQLMFYAKLSESAEQFKELVASDSGLRDAIDIRNAEPAFPKEGI